MNLQHFIHAYFSLYHCNKRCKTKREENCSKISGADYANVIAQIIINSLHTHIYASDMDVQNARRKEKMKPSRLNLITSMLFN